MKSTRTQLLFLLIFLSFAMLMTYSIAKKTAEDKLKSTIEVQLLQIVNKLEITLDRHSYLPTLLGNDSEISTFLRSDKTTQNYKYKQENINLSLEHTNNISGTSAIYLMMPDGEVVSSSNWAEKESLINQDFSSQPYFEQASQNALGRYFSTETKSSDRYYYFARSVQFDNKVIGIITVQVALSDIAFNWIVSEIDFAVTDKNGVVFLTSNNSWDLKAISKTNLNTVNELKNKPPNNINVEKLNDQTINLNNEGFQLIKLLNKNYLMLSQKMELADWDVRVFSRYAIAQKEISRTVLISGILIFLITALAGLLFKIQNQRKEFRQQAREDLENKVRERTKALKQSQEDLIQAAKMAALGQLSAGITHEINNPLTAIRAYADNAGQFLKKDRLDMVKSNVKEIIKLTENMAAITGQLKSFARKSKGELTAVHLDKAINNAISIVHSKIISRGIQIDYIASAEDKNKKVLADEIWLSQILVNLISNAISATNKNNTERNIWINITKKNVVQKNKKNEQTSQQTNLYCIEVKDNGTGIEESNLERIFEPFFTTKPTSKGLGLGLSISFNLAKDMNGTLDARNHESGGALFTLTLPSSISV
ncbi:MAG: two-component system C4-dicarboxylate transport sensor histidine kinase DctB [Cocleimonas sp.]|jgi:two-component system C4-dicarboxylate transport sensor histidine kinase DctB